MHDTQGQLHLHVLNKYMNMCVHMYMITNIRTHANINTYLKYA